MEFQPSADQSWQIWANNVLSASATYPSPFANVHKGDLQKRRGSIGFNNSDTWTMKSRFRKYLPSSLSDESKHDKELEFMALNGIRQFGQPRIGVYADRQRPDPLHLEISSWQHWLNLVYLESVRRNLFDRFTKILQLSKSEKGCGLKAIAVQIKEHHEKA